MCSMESGRNSNLVQENIRIPVKEAARIMGKDYQFVRIGIIGGFLPIGTGFKMPDSNSYTFYISPRLFWEYTGYVSRGKTKEQ